MISAMAAVSNRIVLSCLAALACYMLAPPVGAAVAPATAEARTPRATALRLDDIEAMRTAVQENAERIAEQSRESTQPLANGEVEALEAVIMHVTGRVTWQADEDAEPKVAEVDDVLGENAFIRTGRNSTVTLRVGKNATMLIDSFSRVTLAELVQDGEVLRTRAAVERGRADVKVDHVGLTNDFSIITPSATLAVRGTGFAVRYGGLGGTSVTMARFERMFAIELLYFLNRLSYLLTEGSISSEQFNNPVLLRLFKTIGPPRFLSDLMEDEVTPDWLATGFERIALWQTQQVDIRLAGFRATLNLPFFDPPPPPDPFEESPFDDAFLTNLASFICVNLAMIFDHWEVGLIANDFFVSAPPQFETTFADIMAYCDTVSNFGPSDLAAILDLVVHFCSSITTSDDRRSLCVTIFGQAIVEAGGDPLVAEYFQQNF